jgi:hypothetical protein
MFCHFEIGFTGKCVFYETFQFRLKGAFITGFKISFLFFLFLSLLLKHEIFETFFQKNLNIFWFPKNVYL